MPDKHALTDEELRQLQDDWHGRECICDNNTCRALRGHLRERKAGRALLKELDEGVMCSTAADDAIEDYREAIGDTDD